MAGRIRNRRELREQAEHANGAASDGTSAAAPAAKKARAKAPAAAKRKKPRAVKVKPRLRARWGVFDGGMKQLAIFDYNQRAAAEERVAVLCATKKGLFFLQIVKEAMPEPAQAEGLCLG